MAADTGIELGYHRLTAFDMAKAVKARIDARPTVDFAGLKPGKVYLLQREHRSEDVFQVVKTLPSGKQVVVARQDREGERGVFTNEDRIYAGKYELCKFVELDKTLVSLLGVTHEAVVAEAVARKLDVPAAVRCEHPEMFLAIPERFAVDTGEWHAKTAAERVKEALSKDWGERWPRRAVNAEAVDGWIDEAHRRVAQGRSVAIRAIGINPHVAEDYDRQWAEFAELIDFYRWLRPHVDVGGVFHVEEEMRQTWGPGNCWMCHKGKPHTEADHRASIVRNAE